MIDYSEVAKALAADYLNVYVVDPETDHAYIAELKGYVINDIKEYADGFCYSKYLQTYVANRVCKQDKEDFIKLVMPEGLIAAFADGKERLELNYRVDINGVLHHFSGLYTRISESGEPLRLVAGFRNIDEIISMQEKKKIEGLSEAYGAISDIFLSMHRVDVKENTYTTIKTTDAIKKYSIPNSNVFDKNVNSIIKGLAKESSVLSALQFLDLTTLDERMKDKKHITVNFEGKIAGMCRLHFIREDTDADGKLNYVIFAVEISEESKYQAVFSALLNDYRNVYMANLQEGTARILKVSEDYDFEAVAKLKNKVFPFDELVKVWANVRVHPDDREKVIKALNIANMREVFAKEKEFVGNYQSMDNGKYHNYQFNLKKIDDQNIIAGFRIIDAIIEEHQERARKEKEKEAAFRKEIDASYKKLEEMHEIFVASGMGTWSISLIDGKHPTMEVDSLMRELLGLTGQDLTPEEIYDRWFDNILPEAVPSVLASVEQMKQGLHSENTYLWRHPTLGEHYVRCGGTATKVEGGYVLRGYHYDVDKIVREQKEQEQALAEALNLEKQQSQVISALATIYTTIFRADVDTHEYEVINSVPLMNKVAKKVGNFDEVKEGIIEAFMEESFKDKMRKFLDLSTIAERLKNTNTVVTEYQDPNGRWFEARFIVKSRDKNQTVHRVLYVARDYTEEKIAELKQEAALKDALMAAKHASRAKTTFLNNMSHDIRTPMNAIIGFTALAQTHIENKDQVQDYLAKIHTSSTHLLSLINEILDMSRIESGTVKLEENTVHLPDVLHDLRTMIQGQVAAKQQNLYIDTLDVVNENVITDKLRLNQVLLNIVSNSIKYTNIGGNIFIRVKEKPCTIKDHATYEFTIKDNGIGMSKEFLGTIFDAFTRERSSTVSGIQGTGLGMSITKNIVDMMNGTITVESELGKGSEFVVTLDLKLADKSVNHSPIPELLNARALVVDDDVNTCQSVSKMLREISMRPDWSTSGKEAVIRAKEANEIKDEYKAFIIDYLMPDMNGIETVRQIRRVIGDETPIIVLTAYDWTDFEEEAKNAGVTAFVSKPIFMSELRSVLTKPNEGEATPKEAEIKYDYHGKRALLVEDNELNREIATEILKEAGMEVDVACDGTEAVNTIYKSPEDRYDVVFMDIQMPKMDGYTATREIRTLRNNRKANIPIVAMTANAFDEDRQKAFEAGMNGHIAKPIDMKTIVKTLNKIFNTKN
jgi:signal transduction histidine kinase/CheY-like chemotaxis protein